MFRREALSPEHLLIFSPYKKPMFQTTRMENEGAPRPYMEHLAAKCNALM